MYLYSDVILTRDIEGHGLRAGDVGTVVERHHVPASSREGWSAVHGQVAVPHHGR